MRLSPGKSPRFTWVGAWLIGWDGRANRPFACACSRCSARKGGAAGEGSWMGWPRTSRCGRAWLLLGFRSRICTRQWWRPGCSQPAGCRMASCRADTPSVDWRCWPRWPGSSAGRSTESACRRFRARGPWSSRRRGDRSGVSAASTRWLPSSCLLTPSSWGSWAGPSIQRRQSRSFLRSPDRWSWRPCLWSDRRQSDGLRAIFCPLLSPSSATTPTPSPCKAFRFSWRQP